MRHDAFQITGFMVRVGWTIPQSGDGRRTKWLGDTVVGNRANNWFNHSVVVESRPSIVRNCISLNSSDVRGSRSVIGWTLMQSYNLYVVRIDRIKLCRWSNQISLKYHSYSVREPFESTIVILDHREMVLVMTVGMITHPVRIEMHRQNVLRIDNLIESLWRYCRYRLSKLSLLAWWREQLFSGEDLGEDELSWSMYEHFRTEWHGTGLKSRTISRREGINHFAGGISPIWSILRIGLNTDRNLSYPRIW